MVNSGLLCLLMLTFGVCTNAQDAFYPFGSAAGDTFITLSYSVRIMAPLQSLPYFNQTTQNIHVSPSGTLSMYFQARGWEVISPFSMDKLRVNLSYQQYTSGDVLHNATRDINSYFPNVAFTATWVFVVTWDRLVYYDNSGEATFQVVLISDGDLTFFFMNYGDISSTQGLTMGYTARNYDGSGSWTFLKHCYPNDIIDYVNLNTSSNINVPGRWVIPASFDFNFSCSYPRTQPHKPTATPLPQGGPAQPDEPTATPLPQGDQLTVTPQQQQDQPTVTPLSQQAYIGNVICSESFMAIEVNKTQSEQIRIHEDHLRLNDPSCTLYSNGTHVFANMSLNTCGTVMEEDATDVIFKNEIVSVDGPNDIITRHHLVKIEFFCKYPKKSNVILEFDVHRAPYTFIQKGFGTFTYQFEFFQSSQFQNMHDPSTYPLEYDLGDMMYMQIDGISPVNNTKLFVESCKASPSDDPNTHVSYSIISDGCNQDETVQFYSSHANIVRFGMKTFKFIGLHDQVFITCSVILCEAGNPNTRCSQGCSNTTAAPAVHHQHKREASAAPIQTLKHYISQGPLRLRRSTNTVRDAASTVATDGLNLNLVFVAGCLLAAVGMLCGVLLYTKRPQVVYQPLPSCDGE